MSAFERIVEMLRISVTPSRLFPPTILYNEGWLLRLTLDWFSQQPPNGHVLSFSSGARWFSEALLPSQFLARYHGDPRAEGWTHADGVIGHVAIGESAQADTKLVEDASQLVVTEAKLFSLFSSGVTHAPYFDQAAHSVSCIAEMLHRSKRAPVQFSSLGFFLIAPSEQIPLFKRELAHESIEQKVTRRVSEYDSPEKETKAAWLREWLMPTLRHVKIESVSWEQIVEHISANDTRFAKELANFYAHCLKFNRSQQREEA
jgi:hypothetical protein